MLPYVCRFAVNYTSEELWNEDVQEQFLADVFQAEGAFHQNLVGYNAQSGFTYGMPDGLD